MHWVVLMGKNLELTLCRGNLAVLALESLRSIGFASPTFVGFAFFLVSLVKMVTR